MRNKQFFINTYVRTLHSNLLNSSSLWAQRKDTSAVKHQLGPFPLLLPSYFLSPQHAAPTERSDTNLHMQQPKLDHRADVNG